MFSTMDIRVGIAVQTKKTEAASTGSVYMLDYIPGSLMTKEMTTIDSQTLKPKRSGAGTRRGRQEVKGSLKFRIRRSQAFDYMLASAASGEWTEAGVAGTDGDVLKGGLKNVYLTIFQELTNEDDSKVHDKFVGCIVTKISFSAENNTGLEATVEFVGLTSDDDQSGAIPLTKVEMDDGLELIGDDVKDIVIDGVTIEDYTKLDFSLEQARDPKFVLGKNHAISASASAPRKMGTNLNYFRAAGGAGFTGAGQKFEFKLGDDYLFKFGSVNASYPVHQYGGSDVESMVALTSSYSKVDDTDMSVIRS